MQSGVLAQILGPDGLIVLGVILVVLLFGGSQLPKLARSLGGASHELKKASHEFKQGVAEGDVADQEPATPTAAPAPATPEPKNEASGTQ